MGSSPCARIYFETSCPPSITRLGCEMDAKARGCIDFGEARLMNTDTDTNTDTQTQTQMIRVPWSYLEGLRKEVDMF